MASTKKTRHSAANKQRGKAVKAKPDVAGHCSVMPGPWQLNTAIVFVCVAATVALYAGDLHLGFFRIDDPQYVVGNTWIHGVTWEHIRQILSSPHYLNYSPLHLFSYMLDHAIASLTVATALVAAISFVWLRKTVDYLSEWQDPRSVWYAATRKTNDFHVYYELGWEYLDKSARLGTRLRNRPLPVEQSTHLASLVWKDDPRLPQLLSELSADQHTGPVENAFKEYLQTKASENFDHALATKGEHLIPDLFLSRGVLLVEKGDMQSAKKEFLAQLDEASQLPSPEARQEALIACHYNLAVAEEELGNSKEALSWIRLAEQEQNQLGRTVIPGLTEDRQKLESTVTTHDHE